MVKLGAWALRLVVISGLATGSGCSNLDRTENGALVGSGLGAATGAVIGHQSGNGDAGALIGAAAGAVGGALFGNARQMEEERDAAIAAARQAQAITNEDVVQLAANGLSDDTIINTIRSRGGRFRLGTYDLIALKQSGVSERVIQEMQSTSAPAPPQVVSLPAPRPAAAIVVAPRPRASIVFGPGLHVRHWHRHRHCDWW
jgi:hypothetical protein